MKDSDELNKKQLFKNYKYLKSFARIYLDNHPEVGSSYHKLIELFNRDFSDLKIDYDSILQEEKNELINTFKNF